MSADRCPSCTLCHRAAHGDFKCERCRSDFCCDSHKKRHLNGNDGSCYPFKVESSDSVGRFMVASRDIEEGEIVFADEPVVVGPNHETLPMCLGCLAEIDADDNFPCRQCRYPFCDEACWKLSSSRHREECEILKDHPYPEVVCGDIDVENYHVILPLRLLLSNDRDKDAAAITELLMDHEGERRAKPKYWSEITAKVVRRLRHRFPESSIHRAVGVLDVNNYELHCSARLGGSRALFAVGSLLSHSCVANLAIAFTRTPPYTATFRACTKIKAGTEVCSKYVSPIVCTIRRRPILRESWFFDCRCVRCSDPTEMGSFVGAVLCKKCKNATPTTCSEKRGGNGVAGAVNVGYLLQVDPLSDDSPWRCADCGAEESSNRVRATVDGFMDQISLVVSERRYDLQAFLAIRAEALAWLHPNHEVLCEVAKWALPIICRGAEAKHFPREELELKRRMAEGYLFVLGRVFPGLNKLSAKAAFEHADACLELALRDHDEGRISANQLKINVELSMQQLRRVERGLFLEGNLSAFEEWIISRILELRKKYGNFR